MSARAVVAFQHYGIAPFEVEALFTILNGVFNVQESEVERNYEDNFACMVNIDFPLEFNDYFFEAIGRSRWEKLVFLIKEMRRRTGNKGVMLIMNFIGKPALSFTIAMHNENLFELALEKMEILHELASLQVDSRRLPSGVESVRYEFDVTSYRWHPAIARGNGSVFRYKEGQWITSGVS